MKFVIKEKVGPRNKLVFPFYAAIFWLAVPTGVLGFLASVTKIEWIYSLTLAFFVPLIVLTIPVWPDALKLSKIKKTAAVKKGGSPWSFSRPLTYEWKDSE
jgi:hypothetical protein